MWYWVWCRQERSENWNGWDKGEGDGDEGEEVMGGGIKGEEGMQEVQRKLQSMLKHSFLMPLSSLFLRLSPPRRPEKVLIPNFSAFPITNLIFNFELQNLVTKTKKEFVKAEELQLFTPNQLDWHI